MVTPTNFVHKTDLGPSVLMIKETHHDNKWNAPGGETDKTDDDARAAALREFDEETGGKWRRVTALDSTAGMVRLSPGPQANETWAMFVHLDAQACENELYNEDRSSFSLRKRMHTHLSGETGGYAFVPLAALLLFDNHKKTFKLGNTDVGLRHTRRTLEDIKKIHAIVTNSVPPPRVVAPPAPFLASGYIELHAVHLRVTPPPHLLWGHVARAERSQGVWGGLHVTITGFALRKAFKHRATRSPYKGESVHGGSLADYVKHVAMLLHVFEWRPSVTAIKGANSEQLAVRSAAMAVLQDSAEKFHLAKIKSLTNAHISIGNSQWAVHTRDAVNDPSTKWEIGVAVARIDTVTRKAQVVRFTNAVRLW
jgi:ADP-ribose pyrophosphatase YjhB (NUDIX family)